jgi:hypothetical protein
MGMADPRRDLFVMTCCRAYTGWLPPKEGGRWSGNVEFEVEKCPNPSCPTHRRAVRASDEEARP